MVTGESGNLASEYFRIHLHSIQEKFYFLNKFSLIARVNELQKGTFNRFLTFSSEKNACQVLKLT